MQVQCPHCKKKLKLSDKIEENLGRLESGQKIRIKCVVCERPFALDSGTLESADAGKAHQPASAAKAAKDGERLVKPPQPPDVAWLTSGNFEGQEVVEDVPKALVLFPDIPERSLVVRAVEDFGYMVEQPSTAAEAIEKMRFVNYSGIFLHNEYEPGGLISGSFHSFICGLSMARRRYILYALFGDQFSTLYDLQALTFSANLVVNSRDMEHTGLILKKAIPEYEVLFGPVIEALEMAGK